MEVKTQKHLTIQEAMRIIKEQNIANIETLLKMPNIIQEKFVREILKTTIALKSIKIVGMILDAVAATNPSLDVRYSMDVFMAIRSSTNGECKHTIKISMNSWVF